MAVLKNLRMSSAAFKDQGRRLCSCSMNHILEVLMKVGVNASFDADAQFGVDHTHSRSKSARTSFSVVCQLVANRITVRPSSRRSQKPYRTVSGIFANSSSSTITNC